MDPGTQVEGSSIYPWEKWFNGQVWFLRTHKDFTCLEMSMQSQVYMWATKFGVAVTTRLINEGYDLAGVMLQAYAVDSTWRPNLAKIPFARVRARANVDNVR